MRQGSFLKEKVYLQRSGSDRRSVLVFVTYSGLGDLLMALPLLGMLRSNFYALPLVNSSHENLARLLCQDGLLEDYLVVDESLRFRQNPLVPVKLCFALSRLRPDVVVIYGKHLLVFAAYLGLVGAYQTLFCFPWGVSPPTKGTVEVLTPTGNRSTDYLQFAKRLGVPCKPGRVQFSETSKERLKLTVDPQINRSSYAVVAPWASDPRRQAPLRFFRECIEIIVKEGGLRVLVTGMLHNRTEATSLLSGFSGEFVRDLTGETTVQQMLGLLAGARFLLANDSGNLHLASLVNTRAIIAFGPTAPERLLLDGAMAGLMPLRLGLSCSPCHDSPRRYQCPGPYLQCLRGLAASDARSVLVAACHSPGGSVTPRGSDLSDAVC